MKITLSESKRLVILESAIDSGRKSFVEVGFALTEIRDAQLYRANFGTFEEYCKEKWGWDRRRAYQLIDGSAVVLSLPQNVNNCSQIKNEGQARELARVEPSKRVEVLEKASESGELTAKAIKEIAQEIAPKKNGAKERVDYKPSNGMTFAKMAICQLERIHDKDVERPEALKHVAEWIKKHQ